MQLVGDCLMKAHQGKGLKALALLGVLPDGDSTSENQALPVTVSFQASEEQADAGLLVPCNGKRAADTEVRPLDYKQKKKAGEDLSIVKDPSCQTQVSDAPASAHVPPGLPDAEHPEVSAQVLVEEKAITPNPEQVFAECSQKRILGLLAAMLPPIKSGPTVPLIDLEHVLPLMFQVVISNAGHLNETYHLTLGLLGQLIIRLQPAEVDAAVMKVLSASTTCLPQQTMLLCQMAGRPPTCSSALELSVWTAEWAWTGPAPWQRSFGHSTMPRCGEMSLPPSQTTASSSCHSN